MSLDPNNKLSQDTLGPAILAGFTKQFGEQLRAVLQKEVVDPLLDKAVAEALKEMEGTIKFYLERTGYGELLVNVVLHDKRGEKK